MSSSPLSIKTLKLSASKSAWNKKASADQIIEKRHCSRGVWTSRFLYLVFPVPTPSVVLPASLCFFLLQNSTQWCKKIPTSPGSRHFGKPTFHPSHPPPPPLFPGSWPPTSYMSAMTRTVTYKPPLISQYDNTSQLIFFRGFIMYVSRWDIDSLRRKGRESLSFRVSVLLTYHLHWFPYA